MKRFLNELKRRNVLKAAFSYLAISWALLQIGALLLPLLGFSSSILKPMLIILACAFPAWVAFAYFFELTPDGFKQTASVNEEESIYKTTGKRLNGYIMASLVLAVIFLMADRFFDFDVKLETEGTQKSIAVLPFENMSEASDEYFASGITEDILTQISNIGDLRVLSRYTLKDYESKGKSPSEIGRELGVSNLLVGSIRKRGEQLRISCQLIETNSESESWAKTFDRKLDDVFKIQSEIALEIADNLKTKLTDVEKRIITTSSTDNIAAYNLYLRGRGIYNTYTPKNNEKAIQLFKEALKVDPNYGLALAGLADAYGQAVIRYGNRTRNYLDSAYNIAERATTLYPEIPEVWKALGLAYSYLGNSDKSEESYKKALSLNPNHQESINNLGVSYSAHGRIPEAIKMYKKSAQLEPLNATSYWNLGMQYAGLDIMDVSAKYVEHSTSLNNDKNDLNYTEHINSYFIKNNKAESLEYLKKIGKENSKNPKYLGLVANDLLVWHSDQEARPYLEQVVKSENYDPKLQVTVPLNIAYLLLNENERDSAEALVREQIKYFNVELEKGNDQYYRNLFVAHAVIGEKKEALDAMRKYLENGGTNYRIIELDKRLSTIKDEPEYKELLSDLKKRLAEMRKQVLQEDGDSQFDALDM